jgi:RHS repeat-associated protein
VDGDFTDTEDLVRTLDRRDLSLGRDKGWELKNGSTVENQVIYDYDTAGRFSTVNNGTNTFTYGYNYSQTNATPPVTTPPTPPVPNGPRIGDTNGSYQDYMPYTITKSGTPSQQSIRTFEINRDVLAKIENKAGSVTRSSYTYTVNAIGQRTDLTTAFDLGSGITHNAGETNWYYDDGLGHLTKADAPGTIADRSFEYDHIGNRKKFAESLSLPGSDNYVTNALNQYTTVGAFSPGYDDDGNQTIAQIKPITATTPMSSLFAWDGSNQLAEVKDDATTSRVKYRYDALSRRIARVLPDGNITHFIYDGWNCIAEYTASASTATSLARKRTWGLDLSGQQQGAGGVGGLLCETHGGTPYYPTYDGNGNISEYLNADGSTAAHFEYDAFGRTILPTAANDSNQFTYRFSTKPVEPLTGLYYYGYRWYDPMTGRWPSRDPIEEEGGLNLYGFVGNNGVCKWDLLGQAVSIIDGEINSTYTNSDFSAYPAHLRLAGKFTGFGVNSPDNEFSYSFKVRYNAPHKTIILAYLEFEADYVMMDGRQKHESQSYYEWFQIKDEGGAWGLDNHDMHKAGVCKGTLRAHIRYGPTSSFTTDKPFGVANVNDWTLENGEIFSSNWIPRSNFHTYEHYDNVVWSGVTKEWSFVHTYDRLEKIDEVKISY